MKHTLTFLTALLLAPLATVKPFRCNVRSDVDISPTLSLPIHSSSHPLTSLLLYTPAVVTGRRFRNTFLNRVAT